MGLSGLLGSGNHRTTYHHSWTCAFGFPPVLNVVDIDEPAVEGEIMVRDMTTSAAKQRTH